jgi:predicted metalloprotease
LTRGRALGHDRDGSDWRTFVRWEGREGSSNVEDRRGMRLGGGPALGLGGMLVVGVIALLMGADPGQILALLSGAATPAEVDQPAAEGPPQDNLGQFASVVLRDTEDTWNAIFARRGQSYREPSLVLFSGAVRSACGMSSSAVGPFYCPADSKVYLDTSFFGELERRFGAPGDFASAYVIAHEVGHHVQNLLGVMRRMDSVRGQGSEAETNAFSVKVELQADCFAGVWGHHANRDRRMIEPGDFEEGLRAAAAIGDDRLQSLSQGEVQPETWTHGSSEQRVRWLRAGLDSGDPSACDSFK